MVRLFESSVVWGRRSKGQLESAVTKVGGGGGEKMMEEKKGRRVNN